MTAPRSNRLSFFILGALVLGILGGALFGGSRSGATPTLVAIAQPIGKMWLDGLTMTIVPLVFGLLVTGINSAAKTASAGGVAGRALYWFAGLLVVASAVGAASTLSALALFPIPAASAALRDVAGTAGGPAVASAADMLSGLIPANPIKAAAETSMIQVVIFALLFGFALTRIAETGRVALIGVLQGLVDTMLMLVRWVLLLAPIGIFALAFVVGTKMGGGAVGALLHYVLTIIAACLSAAVMGYGRRDARRSYEPAELRPGGRAQPDRGPEHAIFVGLPAGDDRGVSGARRLGIVRLPWCYLWPSLYSGPPAPRETWPSPSISRASTAWTWVPSSSSWVSSRPPPVSLAAVGLPAQVSFFTTIGPVCLAMGVPIAALPLLLAVETLPRHLPHLRQRDQRHGGHPHRRAHAVESALLGAPGNSP